MKPLSKIIAVKEYDSIEAKLWNYISEKYLCNDFDDVNVNVRLKIYRRIQILVRNDNGIIMGVLIDEAN